MIKTYIYDGGTIAAGAAALQGAAVDANTKRVITAAALVNTTGAGIVVSVYLVPSAGAADASHAVISARTLAPGETYFCPELIGQGLSGGGGVWASGAGATFRYTARDITNG